MRGGQGFEINRGSKFAVCLQLLLSLIFILGNYIDQLVPESPLACYSFALCMLVISIINHDLR